MPLTLLVTEGFAKGTSYTFSEPAHFLVGRDLDAHFRLPEDDRYFSRRHFVVEISPPYYRLLDLRSKNGTLVNGNRVESILLKDGDVISGGQTKLVVRIEADSAETLSSPILGQAVEPTNVQASPPFDPALPKGSLQIPGYQLINEIGRGGMGVVYRAIRDADNQVVAIKTIHPEVRPTSHSITRFLRESEIIRQLQHPGIVAGLDSGETKGILWLAMEFIQGQDGYKILQEQGALSIRRAAHWIYQLLDALAYAHERDFVHRDVKPANMLISSDSQGEKVHLTDFGLARAYQVSLMSGLTTTGMKLGTIKFMPKEQVLDSRTVKPAADQYAAAATFYQLLTNQYLFQNVRTETEWYSKILEGYPTPIQTHLPEIPTALANVIHKALAPNPQDRYPNVREFSNAIQEATTNIQ